VEVKDCRKLSSAMGPKMMPINIGGKENQNLLKMYL